MNKSLWNRYRLEIIVLSVAVLGILLVLIGDWLDQWFVQAPASFLNSLDRFEEGVRTNMQSFVSNLGWSGLVGFSLFMAAALFLVWRVRYHFTHSERRDASACPRCGEPQLHRIHRTWFDRLLSVTLLPKARRYQCANRNCGWKGLLRRTHRQRGRTDTSSPEAQEL